MDAEIELKLSIQQQDYDLLKKTLNELPHSCPQGQKKLTNGYFDTADLQLRRWDMGLRVRGFDEQLEQTIKTAGSVVGGIHTRPEYNISINQKMPDLSLFPSKIWPDGQNINVITESLECIFETNFQRQTWHIEHQGAVVEIALDIGEIIAADLTEPICELEFELLSGQAAALLPLAISVARAVPVRLGKASKAQRGYQLAGKSPKVATSPLDSLPAVDDIQSQKALTQTLANALERWQLVEQRLSVASLVQQTPLWAQLIECIELIENLLTQLNPKNSQLNALVNPVLIAVKTAATATSNSSLATLWRQPQYGQLQLVLVAMLLN
ncbi:CYTH domain-containing protein [Shewanella phaeophyticola]|uniref:CYTH domain-containing protein n=1 Tax=Shewanella phaeophyticola TaxID=2978345 RepID=A0ABT2NY51_9GAMM|nr:CYTH domain-containing protein [Shewanella sp. KJ10-1]MCT8985337.1 CYTH domain-containing protein [Shewanella sp. KJ10-1]